MKACNTQKTAGFIHSYETFGTHEGPGIRFVVFLQGCIGRCLYCHNPDTWEEGAGKSTPAEDVVAKMEKCLPYILSSGGGVTVSGGEPLLQMDFLQELFRLTKERGVHTAIDTSAFYREQDQDKLFPLLDLTDLFIVDVKAFDSALHKQITSRDNERVLRFVALLEEKKKEYWIRTVLVPGLNDAEDELKKLGNWVGGLRFCRNFEFLPYHTLGKHKWEQLGLPYALEESRVATGEDIRRAEQFIPVNTNST
jgi:pyruvate formate lyase activating enzyme